MPHALPISVFLIWLMFYRRISPNPKLFWMFRNMIKFLRWGVVSTSSNPQVGRPPLIGCPRLLVQYIRSYSPYLEAVSPSATWRRHDVVTGTQLSLWQGPTYHGVLVYLTSFSGRLLEKWETKYFRRDSNWYMQNAGEERCCYWESNPSFFFFLLQRIDNSELGYVNSWL